MNGYLTFYGLGSHRPQQMCVCLCVCVWTLTWNAIDGRDWFHPFWVGGRHYHQIDRCQRCHFRYAVLRLTSHPVLLISFAASFYKPMQGCRHLHFQNTYSRHFNKPTASWFPVPWTDRKLRSQPWCFRGSAGPGSWTEHQMAWAPWNTDSITDRTFTTLAW